MDAFADAYCERPTDAVVERAARVRLLVLDVDGVLTDGTLYIGATGEAFKPFHIHDGKGIAMLRAEGLRTAAITARQSQALARRAAELGIDPVRQNVRDKGRELIQLGAAVGIPAEETAYVGDDLVDLDPLAAVGLAVAVADAHPRVLRASHWQTRRPGGRGAVREVCELLLAARGRLQAALGPVGP